MKEMRGLTTFIHDIRACKSREAELKRVNKELANIRGKFGDSKAAKMDGYSRKKYVSKLVFIFLMGYDIEFGFVEAVALLGSKKFSEKQIGYMFVAVLVHDGHDFAPNVMECIAGDLGSTKELDVCLGLSCIANIGGKEMISRLAPLVRRLLVSRDAPYFVKKKAALAFLKMARADRDAMAEHIDDKFVNIAAQLLSHSDMGVCTSIAALFVALASHEPEKFAAATKVAVNQLQRITTNCDQADYVYYGVPAPWLCVKLLRLLQVLPQPSDGSALTRLNETLTSIVARARPGHAATSASRGKPKLMYTNANNAVFFEAVNLLVEYASGSELEITSAALLGDFLGDDLPNVRFLALDGLSRLAQLENCRDEVKKHMILVTKALKTEDDPTVQRRAVDVLYGVCDRTGVEAIVQDLLTFLRRAGYAIREEVVIKVAILAEKHAPSFSWYVSVILTLIKIAGDFVSEEVWHRVLQVITNNPECQDHATKTCFEALLDPSCHEAMVKVGAYVLGEFGHLIANDPLSTPQKQLAILQQHYPMVSVETRSLLLSSYVKFAGLFPEMNGEVAAVLRSDNLTRSACAEIQQRATEYLALLEQAPPVVAKVLEEMPVYEDRGSALDAKLASGHADADTEGGGVGGGTKPAPSASVPLAVPAAAPLPSADAITNDEFFAKFVGTDAGVLYENPVLSISCTSQFIGLHAKVEIFFANRGAVPMTGLQSAPASVEPGALSVSVHTAAPAEIAPGVQAAQEVRAECLAAFGAPPVLNVALQYQGRTITMQLKLPVLLNKFMAPIPTPLDAAGFAAQWQRFEANETIGTVPCVADPAGLEARLAAFKASVLRGIDPNPANFVASALITTSTAAIGVLIRVETANNTARYTVRSTDAAASGHVGQWLGRLLTI